MNTALRQAFFEASQKAEKLANFEEMLLLHADDSPLALAYKAAAKALKAHYHWLPAIKLSLYLEANLMLEKAIAKEAEHLEIRFIRFAIESSLPAAAHNYALHLREDKKVILASLPQSKLPKKFKTSIADCLLASGICTFADKQALVAFASV